MLEIKTQRNGARAWRPTLDAGAVAAASLVIILIVTGFWPQLPW